MYVGGGRGEEGRVLIDEGAKSFILFFHVFLFRACVLRGIGDDGSLSLPVDKRAVGTPL